MKYKKPALTFKQQVDLLAKRGLIIPDRDFAIATLRRISYYRLSAYYVHSWLHTWVQTQGYLVI